MYDAYMRHHGMYDTATLRRYRPCGLKRGKQYEKRTVYKGLNRHWSRFITALVESYFRQRLPLTC